MISWIVKFTTGFCFDDSIKTSISQWYFIQKNARRTWKSTVELFCHFLSERISYFHRIVCLSLSVFRIEIYFLVRILLNWSRWKLLPDNITTAVVVVIKRRMNGCEKDVISSLRQSQSSHAVLCPRLKFLWNEIKNYLDYSRSSLLYEVIIILRSLACRFSMIS